MAGTPRRSWGKVRTIGSGRLQASYIGPDTTRHNAPHTFTTRDAATVWLRKEQRLIEDGEWTPPSVRAGQQPRELFGTYARTWVSTRRTKKGPIKPRTRSEYLRLLDNVLDATFGPMPIPHITPELVDAWWAKLPRDNPTQNARAYSLLRSVLNTAVERRLIDRNPCQIRGAGNVEREKFVEPATLDELDVIVATIPERYKAMILLAAWCALRFGELAELRRSDLDLTKGTLRVRRGLTWVTVSADEAEILGEGYEKTEAVVGTPKSSAGERTVSIPPHVLPAVKEHVRSMPVAGKDALLFPSASDPTIHMRPATLAKVFYRARKAAGREDLAFHWLRHTGLTFAAQTGATLADLMHRAGHATAGAAMRYQHAVSGRDAQIAAGLSDLAARG